MPAHALPPATAETAVRPRHAQPPAGAREPSVPAGWGRPSAVLSPTAALPIIALAPEEPWTPVQLSLPAAPDSPAGPPRVPSQAVDPWEEQEPAV